MFQVPWLNQIMERKELYKSTTKFAANNQQRLSCVMSDVQPSDRPMLRKRKNGHQEARNKLHIKTLLFSA